MYKPIVLIIDDEVQICKLLTINLETNDYKVIIAKNGKEGISLAANHSPDLILLDIGLPDINGHLVLKELRNWFNKAIIILSVEDNEKSIIDALDNGANDYLTKPFRTGELLARIRTAIRHNETKDNQSSIIIDALEINLISRIVSLNNNLIKLTSTEYNLLVLLAKNQGRVLTHQYILKSIWGNNHHSETQYLRVFIAALRKKIEANPNDPKYILTENSVGYRMQ
jgi:two-component system KDP operon response regulator KdpE